MGLGLLAAVTVAYGPALAGGFIWDDDEYVTENETLLTSEGLWRIWTEIGATPQYYPLVFTSFWVEHKLWGFSAVGYHVVNVLLHGAAAWLLWRILRRLEIPGAALAALVFALHPVHVESVAWITERKNVLSGLFYMLAASAWLRFAWPGGDGVLQPRERHAAPTHGRRDYLLALAFFVCALLSKTVTATLPAALLLVGWWKFGRIPRWHAVAALPMFILGLAAGQLTAWVEAHHVGTKNVDLDFSVAERTLIAGRAVWFYASKLLWPATLTFFYPRWRLDTAAAVQWAYPIAAVAFVAALAALTRRIGRGPLTAVLFFGGTLVPALGFVSVYPMRYSFVADHFQYLASIGLIVLTCAGTARLARRASLPRGAEVFAAIVPCVILAMLTFRQAGVYKDIETLWRDTLAKNPDAAAAHNNLGTVHQRQGRLDDAIASYEQALAIPDCPDRPDVLANLAQAWSLKQDRQRAIALYEQALALRPQFGKALTNLGNLLHEMGRLDEARRRLEAATQADSDDSLAWNNLGSVLLAQGRTDEGIACLKRAIELHADRAEAHYNLGNAYSQSGRFDLAVAAYESAIRIAPDDADVRVNLAFALLQLRRDNDAEVHLSAAIHLQPQHPLGNYHLARLRARQGRLDEAAAHFNVAHQSRPDLEPPIELKNR